MRQRTAQLALAGKFALVGTFTLDVGSERMQVSPGYAAIHGLPEGTEDISRDDWRRAVHPKTCPGELLRAMAHNGANTMASIASFVPAVRSDGSIHAA
jgi:hypothetical protein